MEWTIENVFNLVIQNGASDIVLTVGVPPAIWVKGEMQMIPEEPLSAAAIEDVFLPRLSDDQKDVLARTGDLDFSLGLKGAGRFRINVHRQRGTLGAAVRFIPYEVPTFEKLGLPARVLEFAKLPRGMVLVTGGAATGKSTTLASMVDYMNHNYSYHIITLEDPIEYTFHHGKSIIEQREIGIDVASFPSALRHVVRQRPDVVLIGEMRDLDTISTALTAAETGHLVLTTLHTTSAAQTIDRIIDVFPAGQQQQVRIQLSTGLQGVVSQMLFNTIDNQVAAAVEIMVCNQPVRRAIRDGETHLLPGMIETGRTLGMQSMDHAITQLVRNEMITSEQAIASAVDQEKLKRLLAA